MSITWLHLSDLHRGQPADTRWAVSKEHVLDDIVARIAEIGRPDLVLFTGDLAYAGSENDYRLVDDTLNEIYQCIGHDVLLIPVPGNHDLARPHKNELAALACKHYFKDDAVRSGLLEAHKTTVVWLASLFANYTAWWERSVLPRWKSHGLRFTAGLLPGDFVVTFEKDDIRLGIAGLNSAFLHFGDMDEGALAIEYEQLGRVKELARWRQEHDAALLLMHHPKEWLEKSSRRAFLDAIYPGNSFTACCFGHMHENATETVTGGGSETRRWLQAASLFGFERYGKNNETRSVGYSWGRIERTDATSGVLTRWPRVGRTSEGGTLRIRDGEVDPYPQRETVPLRERKPRRACRVSIVAVPTEFPFAETTLVRRIEDLRPGLVCDFISADEEVPKIEPAELAVVLVGGLQGKGTTLTDALKKTDNFVAHARSLESKHIQRADWDPKALATLVSTRGDASVFGTEDEILGLVRPALDLVCKERPVIQDQADDPFLDYVLSDLEERRKEAHAAFADGDFERARDAYGELTHRTAELREKAEASAEVGTAWARSTLNLAACHLALREADKARMLLVSVPSDLLSQDARDVLATALVNVREMELAERVASTLPSDAGERIRQLIAVSGGQVPASKPAAGDQLIYGAHLLIKEDRFHSALEWIITALPGFADETLGKLAALEALMHLLEEWAWAEDWSDALTKADSETLLRTIEALLQDLTSRKLARSHSRRIREIEYGLAVRTDDPNRVERVRALLAQLGHGLPEVDTAFEKAMAHGRKGNLEEAIETVGKDEHPWRGRFRQTAVLTLLGDHSAALEASLRFVEEFPNRLTTEYEVARQLMRAERVTEALPHSELAFAAAPGYGPRLLLANILLLLRQDQACVELAMPLADKGDPLALTLAAQGLEQSDTKEAIRRWREYDATHDELQVKVRIAALELRVGKAADAAEHGWAILARPDARDLSASRLYELALLQAYGSPTSARTRVTEIARLIKERASNPADEALYLQLWAWLDAPKKLPAPDFSRLVEIGAIKPVTEPDLRQTLASELALDSNVREAYRLGHIPFESVLFELRWNTAHYVLSLGKDSFLPAVSVTDPESTEKAPLIGRLLVSELELLLCERLGLLGRLGSALVSPAEILIFDDVRSRFLQTLALMRLGTPRERLQEVHRVTSVIMSPALVIAATGLTRPSPTDDAVKVGDLVTWLHTVGAISHTRAQALVPVPEASEWQPTGELVVRAHVLRWLVTNDLLETVTKAIGAPLLISEEDREALRLDRENLMLEVEALELSERVHSWLEARLEDGRARIVLRPKVDLPPAKGPPFVKLRTWVNTALSWRSAAEENDAYCFTVDTCARDLFSGVYLPQILHALSWSRETYLDTKDWFQPLACRMVGMGWLASSLDLDLGDREWIATTGAVDVLDATTLVRLFGEYGAASASLDRILAILETPLANPLHAKSIAATLLVGRAYAAGVKLLLDDEGSSAADFAAYALNRLSAYSNRGATAFLAFTLPAVFDKPFAAYVPSSPGRYSPSPSSSAGQLFSSIAKWAEVDKTRLSLLGRAAADTVVLIDKATSEVGPEEIVVGVLQLLAELMPDRDGADLTNELIGALATIGGVWPQAPLQTMGITIQREEEGVETKSVDVLFEDILSKGAAALGAADPPKLNPLFASWNHKALDGQVAVRAPVEAILLRATPKIGSELARELARLQGPNDGRMHSTLVSFAANPEDRVVRHLVARRSIQSPWKQVLRDPSNIFLWARADGVHAGAPIDLKSFLDLLSEPLDFDMSTSALKRLELYLAGGWKDRSDRRELFLLAANVPGALGAQVANAFADDEQLADALRALRHDGSVSSADLWTGLTALWMAATTDRKLIIKGKEQSTRVELQEQVERLVSSVLEDPERGQLEAQLLKQCRGVVANFHPAPNNQLWLTYRLLGWLWVQLRSQDANHVRAVLQQMASWSGVSYGDADPRDPMDPLKWQRAHDLRLMAVMNVLALGDSLPLEDGRTRWYLPVSESLRENLIRIASKEITDADRELRLFDTSEFQWLGTAMPQESALFLLLRESGGLLGLAEEPRLRWLQELPTGQPNHGIREAPLVERLLVGAAAAAPQLSDLERTTLAERLLESSSSFMTTGLGQAIALLSLQRLGLVATHKVWPRIKDLLWTEGTGAAIARMFAEALVKTNADDLPERLLELEDVLRGPSKEQLLSRIETDPVFESEPGLVELIRHRLAPPSEPQPPS